MPCLQTRASTSFFFSFHAAGAADDGAQVAVMLELARAILSKVESPDTPLLFLWTGGEEPISPVGADILIWWLLLWVRGAPEPDGCRQRIKRRSVS